MSFLFAKIMAFLKYLFFLLPSFDAFLLAALGVAIPFTSEVTKWLETHPRLRRTLASIILLCGLGGVVADRLDRKEQQDHQGAQISELRNQFNVDLTSKLSQQEKDFFDRLDFVVKNGKTQSERDIAARMRNELQNPLSRYTPTQLATLVRNWVVGSRGLLQHLNPDTAVPVNRAFEDNYYETARTYRKELLRRLGKNGERRVNTIYKNMDRQDSQYIPNDKRDPQDIKLILDDLGRLADELQLIGN